MALNRDRLGPEYQPQDQTIEGLERERKRKRSAIACGACRDRKTRCSGDQPTCYYCRKAGVECVYVQGGSFNLVSQITPAGLDEWGSKILKAIDQIAGSLGSAGPCDPQAASIFLSNSSKPEKNAAPCFISIESRTSITGISSILAWKVFGPARNETVDYSLVLKQTNQAHGTQYGQESGSTTISSLMDLSNSFVSYFLPVIPILDVAKLEGYIGQIGENGAEWTTESCLVFLVAALGSIGQQEHRSKAISSTGPSTPGSAVANSSKSIATAFRYWNMARKRLGWALEESGLLSAQCLCLAGIWHLRNFEPVSAWKMFHDATLSIKSTTPSDAKGINRTNSSNDEKVRALEQRVLEVCLRYECELQSELDMSVPPSTQAMPVHPSTVVLPDPRNVFSPIAEVELCFRSADMSLLQIRQTTLTCFRALSTEMSWKEISALNTELSAAQLRLENWYTNLPPELIFPIYEGPGFDIKIADDCHRGLLQYRYFEVKELILRPSLYICLHIDNAAVVSDKSDANKLDLVVRDYFIAESREKAIQHQAFTLLRLKIELSTCEERQFAAVDGPWFRTYNCFLLALLLLAPHRRSSGTFEITQLMHPSWSPTIRAVEAFLRSSDASGNGKEYAILLHNLLME